MSGRTRSVVVLFAALVLLAAAFRTDAQLTPPAAPTDPASARYTLGDVWNRLATGAAGSLRTGAFLEPAAGPGTPSTKTTNEVMAAAPAADNANGATAAMVLKGKTFWGLRTTGGTWGAQAGTMNNRGGVTITPGMSAQAIPDGYHDGTGTVSGDGNLRATNIKDGVEIFGVTGTAIVATGTAVVANVLAGATFSNATASGLTGTMANRGAVTITPGTSAQSILAGYHNGSGSVAGDADLVAGNIRSGVDLFGVAGTVIQATGDAVVADVLSGKTFSKSGAAGLTGTMPNRGAVTITPGTAAQTIAAGYHNGSGTVEGDSDLVAANIRSGKNIFGVVGTYPPSGVPRTGHEKCWKLDGTTWVEDVGCALNDPPGQDGHLLAGVIWPFPRFTDNGDGTVTDNLTKLVWLKDITCFGTMDWAAALEAAATLNHLECGLTDHSNQGDWRLPNRRELFSLVTDGYYNPALPNTTGNGQWAEGDPFTAGGRIWSTPFWTSTTRAGISSYAWRLTLYGGEFSDEGKNTNASVWPVRGGR
jgi:hypothetical protein